MLDRDGLQGGGLATLHTTPEFALGGDDQVLVDFALGAPPPFGAPGWRLSTTRTP